MAWQTIGAESLNLEIEDSTTLRCDREKLLRLFENLFGNVADHADGATTVWVGADKEGFYVEDDGDGVTTTDDVLADGYSSKSERIGLGLSVVNAIAEAHGLSLRVTTGRENGFRIDVDTATEAPDLSDPAT